METTELSMAPAKRAVLSESLKLFATRGVEAVSIRDIAAATGYTNPALFRHFPSKDALAFTLFETCYRRFVGALRTASAASDLRRWLSAAITEIDDCPEAVHFLLENLKTYWPRLPDDLKALNLPSLSRAMLEREQREGRMRADINIRLANVLILGALGQLARSAHFHKSKLDVEALAEDLAALLLRGLGVDDPAEAVGNTACS
jgi:AcrR family transcriptional regulator